MSKIIQTAQNTLKIEADSILQMIPKINDVFEKAAELILSCQGKVVVTGMGKSGHIGKKISSTFSSTGTPSVFLHPAESRHGDLGVISKNDIVIAISYGGESSELIDVLNYLNRQGIPLIALTGKKNSSLAQAATLVLDISVEKEACPMNLAPTSSSTVTLALGDALAMSVLELRGFKSENFAELHPAGSLGAKLQKVKDIMKTGQALPFIKKETSMKEIVTAMTHQNVRGAAVVLDEEGQLIGVITDGDIRRFLEKNQDPFSKKAEDLMSKSPRTIDANEFAEKALFLMEQFRIQMLIVLDKNSESPRKPVGMLVYQDLLTAKVR